MRLLSVGMVACVCIGIVFGSLAQISQTKKHDDECGNPVTTAAMRSCEASRYATAQSELNAAYRGLMEHLDNGQRQKLRQAQRAWLRFRDSDADFQASLVEGGTLAPLIRITVLTDMTKARTLELSKKTLP